MKQKWKKVCAGALALTLFSTTILPHIGQKKVEAFSSKFGVCVDNHNYSSAGSYVSADTYTNKMNNMNDIEKQYGYKSEEYNAALQANIDTLHQYFGTDDDMILRMFWSGIVTFATEGKSFANANDLLGVQKWIDYAIQNYQDSVWHGYAPALASYDFHPMNETELGTVLHGAAGQAIIDRDPLLKMLVNSHTLFPVGEYDPNRNYATDPLALPRLGNAWLNSYEAQQSGNGGKTLWPKDSAGHEVAGTIGFIPTYEQVAQAALDMDTNSDYYTIHPVTIGAGNNNSPSIDDDEDWDDDDDESEVGPSAAKKDGYYVINCTEDFFNNCGWLKVWNGEGWISIGSLTHYNQRINVNGWEIRPSADEGWAFTFEWKGEGKPQGLVMYFELPQNSVVSSNQKGFDSPVEFVARYTNLYTCDTCGHSSGKREISAHQRHISFYFPEDDLNCYPCFRLGDPNGTPKNPEVDMHFCIFRHLEDWESNYNVQLTKHDYETGEKLEGSVFELYERFDDKDQINRGHDGAVELYEGIDNDTDQEWQSKYTSKPVVWDDFRLVNSYTTDTNGHVEEDVKKGYHYEKTFCDGHPAPGFCEVPEEDESEEEGGEAGNADEIEAAQQKNKEVANLWLEYYDACTKMAEEDRPGVHFHWLNEEVDMSVIEEIAESGGEPGDTPDAGTSECPGLDTSYDESGCHEDCQDTYDKFIELEYSYTWIENKAREGYIRHDLHTDDVPIEVITTNSSEAGAKAHFADEYSKDITINKNPGNSSQNSGDEDEDDDFETEEQSLSFNSIISSLNPFAMTVYATEDDMESEESFATKAWNVLEGKAIDVMALFTETEEEKQETVDRFEDEEWDDDELDLADYEIDFEVATNSNATYKSKTSDVDLGFLSFKSSSRWNSGISMMAEVGEPPEESAAYDQIYKDAFKDPQTGGEKIKVGPKDNWSHCNDTDGEGNEWRVYDHRTPGEIHFNKRDMDLADLESEEYNAYADANADGKMEGAIYGLFASQDIVHPDGKTGVVFKKNDLVAIATTDRNGDGSFMVITEAPGTIYSYEKGETETTDWNAKAPKNLYREGAKSAEVQPHVAFNDGETTEWFCDDYTEDDTYKGGLTQRLYDNNEGNNMNSWIGRPLLLGEYYIKELSRSEGYELSVNGRLDAITNKNADLNVSEETSNGSVTVSRNLYIQGQETIGLENEPFFEVTSEGTIENGGYDIVLTKLPEGTKIYRHDSTIEKGTYQAIDHYEYVGKVDENGNPVYKTAKTTGIPILKGDGTNDILTVEEQAKYYVNQIYAVNLKNFDEERIANSLKGNSRTNDDGTISYPDYDTMQTEFTMGPDSTYFIRFVKWKTEAALRTAGITTPNIRYTTGGVSQRAYSEQEMPYYSRGIREGEVDTYGVAGASGTVATKTVYGPQIINIEVSKTNDLGNPITNGDMIYNLIQYYMDHPYWNFGGIDNIVDAGDHYNVYIYAHNSMYDTSFAVLGETNDDTVIYRRIEFNPDDTSFEPYVVYVPYTSDESDDSFDTYSNLKIVNSYGTTRISATLDSDVVIDGDGNLSKRIENVPVTYEIGDVMHDKDGNPEQELEPKPVYVEREIDELRKEWTEIPVKYENGKYIIHVDMPGTDIFGKEITDADGKTTLEFKAVVPKRDVILSEQDAKYMPSYYGVKAGDIVSSGLYEVEVEKARAYAYLDYATQTESNDDTFIKSVLLSYPSDERVFQDGDGNPGEGTRLNPIRVMERPIRQKVKIVKDIQTIPGSEEYLHDTYSEVHTENLSKNDDGLWYDRFPDWLTSLLGGNVEKQTASKIPEFRFKIYLKSNLERLYRDADGNITWLDRNGNALVPEYKDTNFDGNYETFVWRNGNNVTDFPEESKVTNGILESVNVQKLYTKVEHVTDSTTAGDISNNVWAVYDDPQTGSTENVGELRGYNTSQDEKNGEAVKTNASLYSYKDKNTNVAESDRINKNANTGYTRLLESTVSTIEDGAGKTRQVETYNYEKFFDAMAAANNDKWDNDMWASTKNYPGQHWFDTFEERYQMDDTDPDRTLANVDGEDVDGTAGGDRDTSFKPFQWIREHMFGTTQDAKDDYPATHDNDNLENTKNTSAIAHRNAEASDEVRQFAIKWYLDDEVAKLVENNGYDEDVAKVGHMDYQEQVYDEALEQALIKAYNYLKPFYENDLDTIYAVMWDSAENGGSDGDVTTLSADILYETEGNGDQGESKSGYYYGVSAYLPYGTYVAVEQQPFREDLGDFDNKHYRTDKPKEIVLPAVYAEGGNAGSPEVFNSDYNYDSNRTPEQLAAQYMIRFNEEWAATHTDDLRNYVIRAHNYDGDYEVYKYGLDVDKLISTIDYDGDTYTYDGYTITQSINDPLKDYYNTLVDSIHDGGNENSHYLADEDNKSFKTASGIPYTPDAIEKRYHYGSISENAGTANDVIYQHGNSNEVKFSTGISKDDNNPSGFYFKDNVKTMTGNQTAYDGKYASMLVPWSIVEPADSAKYDITNYTGYADAKYRNTFYVAKLRIEKVDSETGEQILHDDAIFSIYAASRYTSREEIEKAGAPAGTEIGDVKFYMEDTMITGSKEFLESMGAWNIKPVMRGRSVGLDELYTGTVAAGTPVCVEDEQIIMEDMLGNKTGQFKVYATLNDIKVVDEEDAKGPADKGYVDQNTGYLITPQPLGAGVYVITETKAPAGYAKTRPIAVEIYSDNVSYYMNGLMDSKVEATIYQGNLMDK